MLGVHVHVPSFGGLKVRVGAWEQTRHVVFFNPRLSQSKNVAWLE